VSNPKTEPTDNTKKDPDEWVSGNDPMTGAQAAYLKTLCEQADTPEALNNNLTKAEASKLIDDMRQIANGNPVMTDQQREEIKRLCQEADVPDKSGEFLTPEGAQHFIDDLKKQTAERK
jgi:polyhydroxyalkanoate synthesis regulator phasin